MLTSQLKEQADNWKAKEVRLIATQERQKKRIAEMEAQNKELAHDIFILERDRAALIEVNIKSNITPRSAPKPAREIQKSNSADQLNPKQKHTDLKQSIYLSSNNPLLPIKQRSNSSTISTRASILVVKEPNSSEAIKEPKRVSEVDPAKSDLDQLQQELGLDRFAKVSIKF